MPWFQRLWSWLCGKHPTYWVTDVDFFKSGDTCMGILNCRINPHNTHGKSAHLTIQKDGYKYKSSQSKGYYKLDKIDSVAIQQVTGNGYRLLIRTTHPDQFKNMEFMIESIEVMCEVKKAFTLFDSWAEKLAQEDCAD